MVSNKESLEQDALEDLNVENPLRFGGMYCSLEFRVRHGYFGLWEKEFSGYYGPSYTFVKKISMSEAYEFSLSHPIVQFTHDDTKEEAKTKY